MEHPGFINGHPVVLWLKPEPAGELGQGVAAIVVDRGEKFGLGRYAVSTHVDGRDTWENATYVGEWLAACRHAFMIAGRADPYLDGLVAGSSPDHMA